MSRRGKIARVKRKIRSAISSHPALAAIAGALVVALGAYLAAWGYSSLVRGDEPRSSGALPPGKWTTYESEKWGFELDIPAGWEVYEGSDPYVPVVNVYVPAGRKRPPFDQSADVANVSVYPLGIKDTNIFSARERGETEVLGAGDATETRFVLEDGAVWARQLNFAEAPAGWKPWGFVWGRASVANLAFGCARDGAEVPFDECQPLEGDDVVRRGELDRASAQTVERIVRSLRFPAGVEE
jgi:hypothetical protein